MAKRIRLVEKRPVICHEAGLIRLVVCDLSSLFSHYSVPLLSPQSSSQWWWRNGRLFLVLWPGPPKPPVFTCDRGPRYLGSVQPRLSTQRQPPGNLSRSLCLPPHYQPCITLHSVVLEGLISLAWVGWLELSDFVYFLLWCLWLGQCLIGDLRKIMWPLILAPYLTPTLATSTNIYLISFTFTE